ncbi:MAG: hypothetical protein U0325_32725 [Polyangiales bacterium]
MSTTPVSGAPYREPSAAPPVTFVVPPSPPPRSHLLATFALTVAASLCAAATAHLAHTLSSLRPAPPRIERPAQGRRAPSLREAAEDLARRHRGALFIAPDVPMGALRLPVTDALDGTPRDATRALDAWAATRGLWFHDADGVLRLERAVTAVDFACDDALDACATRLERVASVTVQRAAGVDARAVHLRLTHDTPAVLGARDALAAAGFAVDVSGRTLWVAGAAPERRAFAPRPAPPGMIVLRRADVEGWLLRGGGVGRATRIVPAMSLGRVVGVRVVGLRGDDALAGLGIRNGDVIHRVNGVDLASPDRCLEAYARLRVTDEATVALTRGGRRVHQRYLLV